MQKFTMTIPGEAQPQCRPRVTMARGFAQAYETGPVKAWKKRLSYLLAENRRGQVFKPPFRVCLVFLWARPDGQLSKRTGKPTKSFHPLPKPSRYDLDNLAKPILDVMKETGWFRDDGECAQLICSKQFGTRDETVLKIEELDVSFSSPELINHPDCLSLEKQAEIADADRGRLRARMLHLVSKAQKGERQALLELEELARLV